MGDSALEIKSTEETSGVNGKQKASVEAAPYGKDEMMFWSIMVEVKVFYFVAGILVGTLTTPDPNLETCREKLLSACK